MILQDPIEIELESKSKNGLLQVYEKAVWGSLWSVVCFHVMQGDRMSASQLLRQYRSPTWADVRFDL